MQIGDIDEAMEVVRDLREAIEDKDAEIAALKQENDALRQEAANWRSAKALAESKETAVHLALNDMRKERDASLMLPTRIAKLLHKFKFESSPHDKADDTILRLTFVLTRFDEIMAERDELRELLRRCEWSSFDDWAEPDNEGPFCPICQQYREDGHTEDCQLFNALKEVG